jgi:HD-GYP domain-containing protein (c-di-GMP phosphodiesterase class II)
MVYRLVNSTYNVQELTLRLTRLLCQFIKANLAVIYILDPKSKKVILKAIYDNKINILVKKGKELTKLSEDEKKVLRGYIIFRKNLIGIPLVADDNIGAVFVQKKKNESSFDEFDREMVSVVVEQSVTAIKNLQLYEEQQKAILGSIEFIGKLLERNRSIYSDTHSPAYFKIIKSLCEKLNIGKEVLESLYYASALRDAGAIDVPYNILTKKSQLTPEEFKTIREQPAMSVELIKPVEFLKPVLPIILYHHEKYDGTGYPSGLKKEQIPIEARIMAVVDAFEAMTRDRPYKTRLLVKDAIRELRQHSGSQFDPKVVSAFVELSKQKKFRNYLSSR